MVKYYRPGLDKPSVQLAHWYDGPRLPDSNTSPANNVEAWGSIYSLCRMFIMTKGNEPQLKVLNDNGYDGLVGQYILFTEHNMFTMDPSGDGSISQTTPNRNTWSLSSIPWRTASEYDPTQYLHLGPVTYTGGAVSAGATTITVPDCSKFQQVANGHRGIVDVVSDETTTTTIASSGTTRTITTSITHAYSTGNYVYVNVNDSRFDGLRKVTGTTSSTFTYTASTSETVASTSVTGYVGRYYGLFHYTAISASTGSGTLTIPASGYGSVGFAPATLSGVGATNPFTGAAWDLPTSTIPASCTLRSRGQSSSRTGLPGGPESYMLDPSSTVLPAWCAASYAAYQATTTTGTPTVFGGLFLDNMHTTAVKWTSGSPSGVLPTPLGSSTAWTLANWHTYNAAFLAQLASRIEPPFLAGNTYPLDYSSTSNANAIRDVIISYAAAGLTHAMLENAWTNFPSAGASMSYLSQANFVRALQFTDDLTAAGIGRIDVVLSGRDYHPALDTAGAEYAAAMNLLTQSSRFDVYTRFCNSNSYDSSDAVGTQAVTSYGQLWTSTAWFHALGRPTSSRSVTGTAGVTSLVYSRSYQFGSVQVTVPVTGSPTAVVTRTQ